MNRYLVINIAVIALPLILSFDRRVAFYRQWRAVFPAILLVGAFYLAEDVLATRRGTWSFAPEWSGGWTLLHLPLGEWLFFITVPYACIFVYACVRSYVREKEFPFPRILTWLLIPAVIVPVLVFRNQRYTRTVLAVFAFTLALAGTARSSLFRSRQFWTAMGITYLLFLLVNGVLTGVQVVIYNPRDIWGGRFITIPWEDFFYNFSLLTLNFHFYRIFLDGFGKVRGNLLPGPGFYAGYAGRGETSRPAAAYRFMEKDSS